MLEAKLQGNTKGIRKWDPRARLGVYLGHSPLHAASALVLNPGTGHVSPQYHLVFDDEFTTVRHLREGTVPCNWKELVLSSSFSSTDEQYSLNDTWLNQNSLDPEDPNSVPPVSASRPLPSSRLVSEGASVQFLVESSTSVSEGAAADSRTPVSEGAAAASRTSVSEGAVAP